MYVRIRLQVRTRSNSFEGYITGPTCILKRDVSTPAFNNNNVPTTTSITCSQTREFQCYVNQSNVHLPKSVIPTIEPGISSSSAQNPNRFPTEVMKIINQRQRPPAARTVAKRWIIRYWVY